MNAWGSRTRNCHPAREILCDLCGGEYTARASHAKYCPACRRLAKEEQRREHAAEVAEHKRASNLNKKWVSRQYEIVVDADARGGFARGARFGTQEMQWMLVAGVLTPGTIVVDRDRRKRLVVVGQNDREQEFRELL